MSKTPPTDQQAVIPPRLTPAAFALWAQSESRKVATDLVGLGIPVLMLKGPDLQMRLYGTPVAYVSSDVDVLVPRAHAERARSRLSRQGWIFSPDNGVLWRLSGAASFDRDGFSLDLHWGLHAAHLPAWTLRKLERRLWAGATPGPSGMLEPDIESLLVFLAVHAVGHGFERAEWTENVRRAASLVADWDEVWCVAREAGVTRAVRTALAADHTSTPAAILDGAWGSFVSGSMWVARGHFIPASIRDRLRNAAALGREGFGYLARRRRIRIADDVELSVPVGVFRPWALSEELAAVGVEMIENSRSPVVVDVGTGAGAVAVLIARARPDASVHATDVSARAVVATRKNVERLRLVNVDVHRGDLLDALPAPLRGRVDAVVTNVPADPPSASRPDDPSEPKRSLVGSGSDGLGLVRVLAMQARGFLRPGGRLVVTVSDWQWDVLAGELGWMGYRPVAVHVSKATGYRYAVAERT